MRLPIIVLVVCLAGCSHVSKNPRINKMPFTEADILKELDLAYKGIPGDMYPPVKDGDIKYNFFLDLEQGYCVTAGSRIHLYADSVNWAVVFEKTGYHNRQFAAEIELVYVGNCIKYPVDKTPERNYISNTAQVILIDADEFERIRNKDGEEMEQFELISKSADSVSVRNVQVGIEHDAARYAQVGIQVRDYDNAKKLPGYEDLVRFLYETNPVVVRATEDEIRRHIFVELPKLMVIDKFHFESIYQKNNLPSKQETYQLIAKVLCKGDTSFWNPTKKPNNHWRNWESGTL